MTYNKNYLESLSKHILSYDEKKLMQIVKEILKVKKNDKKIILVGNGGSASISSHVSVDLTKVCKIRSMTFNEPNLITCFVNDYGQDHWVKEAIKSYFNKNDLVILISSSGNSKNIVNAAKYCNRNDIKLITLSGFSGKNKLTKLGNINLIVNSSNYNHIEMTHHVWLLCCLDRIVNFKF